MTNTMRQRETTETGRLLVAIEMSLSKWGLSAAREGQPRKRVKTVTGGDYPALLEAVADLKERFKLAPEGPVVFCYEAGRDGFYPYRRLAALGHDVWVIDSASIEESHHGIISQVLGEKKISVLLDREFDLDEGKMQNALRKNRPKIVFLSSPNNPTGNCISSDRILKIVEASPGIVVVDEAYQPFSSDKGFLPLLKDYRNLVIMRTLSKIGLAALRFGFLVADEEIIEEVNKVRLPFNVNALSQAVAIEALKDRKSLRTAVRAIAAERDRLMQAMEGISGVHAISVAGRRTPGSRRRAASCRRGTPRRR